MYFITSKIAFFASVADQIFDRKFVSNEVVIPNDLDLCKNLPTAFLAESEIH